MRELLTRLACPCPTSCADVRQRGTGRLSLGVRLVSWLSDAGGLVAALRSRTERFEPRVDGDFVVVKSTRAGLRLTQLLALELAEIDRCAHAAQVDPAEKRLGLACNHDELGYAPEDALSDPVAMDHFQAEPDFSAVVHEGNRRPSSQQESCPAEPQLVRLGFQSPGEARNGG